jgi:hypothetical protein
MCGRLRDGLRDGLRDRDRLRDVPRKRIGLRTIPIQQCMKAETLQTYDAWMLLHE